MKKRISKILSYVMVFAMIFGIVNIGVVKNVNAAVDVEADMQLFAEILANTDIEDRVNVVDLIANQTDDDTYVFDESIVPSELVDDIVNIIGIDTEETRRIILNALNYMKSHADDDHATYINYALTRMTQPLDSFAGKSLEDESNALVAKINEKFYSYNLFLNFLMDVKAQADNRALFYDNNNTIELSDDLELLIAVAEGLANFAPGGRYETYKAMLEEYLEDTNDWANEDEREAFISDLKELGLCVNKPTPPVGGGGGSTPALTTETNDAGKVTVTTEADGSKKATLEVDTAAVEKKISASTDGSVKLDLTSVKDAAAVSVEIPAEALNKVVEGNKTVTMQFEKAAIVLPVEVLKQIADTTAVKATININIVKDAPAVQNEGAKEVAPVVDFTITAGDKKVSNFEKPVKVTIKVEQTKVSDYRKVIAYYYNETTKTWEAVGGYMNKLTGELIFAAKHFSKYTAVENSKTFSDVNTPWAKDNIEVLAARNIMNGVGGDKFSPKANISRAEVAAILARILELETKEVTGKFTDVAANKWYAKEIEAAANAGIITGIGGNKFAPEAEVTREQIAAMVFRALEYKQGKVDFIPKMTFTDASEISSFAKDAVAVCAHKGIVKGSGNKFAPTDKATREQAAVMIYRLLEVLGQM